jgi:hypothetical protein
MIEARSKWNLTSNKAPDSCQRCFTDGSLSDCDGSLVSRIDPGGFVVLAEKPRKGLWLRSQAAVKRIIRMKKTKPDLKIQNDILCHFEKINGIII